MLDENFSDRNLEELEKKRRELHNAVQDLKGAVRVYARIRPLKVAKHQHYQTTKGPGKVLESAGRRGDGEV